MAEQITSEEEQFRKKSQWLSFKGSLYGALSSATFIGVAGKLVMTAVDAVSAGEGATAAIATLSNPVTMGLMAAALVAGVAFTYMSQNEWVDLKYIQDDHLAKRNAECLQKSPGQVVSKSCEVVYEQNQRADGKKWVDAARSQQQHAVSL